MGVSRCAAAAIAAFKTIVSGGFIPQAKQGDKSVDTFELAGSKPEGTGLENEHIGHIHVAFTGFGDGLALCSGEGWRRLSGEPPAALPVLLPTLLFFGGLG